jgi:hypothetical protein
MRYSGMILALLGPFNLLGTALCGGEKMYTMRISIEFMDETLRAPLIMSDFIQGTQSAIANLLAFQMQLYIYFASIGRVSIRAVSSRAEEEI